MDLNIFDDCVDVLILSQDMAAPEKRIADASACTSAVKQLADNEEFTGLDQAQALSAGARVAGGGRRRGAERGAARALLSVSAHGRPTKAHAGAVQAGQAYDAAASSSVLSSHDTLYCFSWVSN